MFQGRFKGILVERDRYLLELARYVVLNPVRARMVAQAAEWPWSSYGAMVGQARAPDWLETDWLLAQFGGDRAPARAGYAAFVAAGVGQPSVWGGLRHQVFLGAESFVDRFTAVDKPLERLREVPRAQRRALVTSLADFERGYSNRREAMAQAFLISLSLRK
ncbi:hypothetical protein [Thiorhodovibrio frisius]|uniref:hypothetical protein n=1 Tax=Thiorhodovibrio frisius TaxID=631362 RepID=UPI00022C7711|nr:hypothetical protein [Thiorhodovibrio frisius]WPL20080.1 Transposase [Thiorhodovibrio frisius]